jgi:hypothetical protein
VLVVPSCSPGINGGGGTGGGADEDPPIPLNELKSLFCVVNVVKARPEVLVVSCDGQCSGIEAMASRLLLGKEAETGHVSRSLQASSKVGFV